MAVRRAPWPGWILLGLWGCRDRAYVPPSAGGGGSAGFDAGGATDGAPGAIALDFTVTGCPDPDRYLANRQCAGAAPLTLGFSPVSSAPLFRLLWDFGDGTPASFDRAPSHDYTLPGLYDVTLVGDGSQGTVSRTRRGFILVAPAAAGATCDVDAQCAAGLTCLCGAAAPCAPTLARGLCSASCGGGAVGGAGGRDGDGGSGADAGSGAGGSDGGGSASGGRDGGAGGAVAGACSTGAICGDLAPGGAGEAGGPGALPWRSAICLRGCATDGDCDPGLRCRDLPGDPGAVTAGWVKGCFGAFPLDVGSPCRAADGALAGGQCTSGRCEDLGALGLCAAACDELRPCPSGSACASFGDGRALCLQACLTAGDCTRDPLLGCETAGTPGALGFTIATPPSTPIAASYCAPRTCVTDADCGPAGICAGADSAGDGGHCIRPAL
jgi:PKD repeat protein